MTLKQNYVLAQDPKETSGSHPLATTFKDEDNTNVDNNNNIWRDFSPKDRERYQQLNQRLRHLRLLQACALVTFVALIILQYARIHTGQADCVSTYGHYQRIRRSHCKDTWSHLLTATTFFVVPVILAASLAYQRGWVERKMEEITNRTAGSTEKVHIAPVARPLGIQAV